MSVMGMLQQLLSEYGYFRPVGATTHAYESVFHLSGEAGAAVLAYEQPLLWWVIGEDATVARRKRLG
jgi:hypothetical protein